MDVLAGALTLACPQGYARVFADEGPPMGSLLGRLVAAQKTEQAAARDASPPCLARPLRVFGQEPARPDSGQHAMAAPGLVEQLTARELEILVLLAAGMPNPRIAQELVVSLDTLKSTSATCWASSARPTHRGRHPGPPARPDPLTARPRPGRHCRAMSRQGMFHR